MRCVLSYNSDEIHVNEYVCAEFICCLVCLHPAIYGIFEGRNPSRERMSKREKIINKFNAHVCGFYERRVRDGMQKLALCAYRFLSISVSVWK